jgi:hypothetical protein
MAWPTSVAVILAFDVRAAQQGAQVQIALTVLAQEHQARDVIGIFGRAEHDVRTDDGLDPGSFGGPVELDHCEEVMLIGYRHGRHAQFADPVDQALDSHRAVDH